MNQYQRTTGYCNMKRHFTATIYKTGINTCVDVPDTITREMVPQKGYILVRGRINHFIFTKTLVPVKNGPYRLFVNTAMLKGAATSLGSIASFSIEQDHKKAEKNYPVPDLLSNELRKNKLSSDFNNLTASRKKDVLKYLSYIKTEETLKKNIDKLMQQLREKKKNVRLP